MSPRAIAIAAVLVTLPGCDKAKSIIGKGSDVVDMGAVVPGGDADPGLEALVVRDGEGVRFRRDQTFPSSVNVRMRVVTEYENARVIESSAFGREASLLNEKQQIEATFRKRPGTLNIELDSVGWLLDANAEETDAPKEKHPSSMLVNKSLEFALFKSGWGMRRSSGPVDFQKVVWADSLEDRVPQMMVECGAHPRVQWFSSSRTWHRGDQITLTGSTLKIIDPFDVSGRVALVFEGTEAIGGHPCGVFAISGDYDVRDRVDPDGWRNDADISITQGKVWASLLHPVILREEYDTVQTVDRRQGKKKGGPSTRIQGVVKIRKSRDWQPVEE